MAEIIKINKKLKLSIDDNGTIYLHHGKQVIELDINGPIVGALKGIGYSDRDIKAINKAIKKAAICGLNSD